VNYPTLDQVEAADHEQICRWYRFLPPARTDGDVEIISRIYDLFHEWGGFTPALSKKIGWTE
jgi:hypothetical protein